MASRATCGWCGDRPQPLECAVVKSGESTSVPIDAHMCGNCGVQHEPRKVLFPARDSVCHGCQKIGHLKRVCNSKKRCGGEHPEIGAGALAPFFGINNQYREGAPPCHGGQAAPYSSTARAKHAQSNSHKLAMSKWIALKRNKRQEMSVLVQLGNAHRDMVQKNRTYLRVIVESILFTAQQNIPQRGHSEDRSITGEDSEVNRGNLIELLHLRCRDIPWLAKRLTSQLATHQQWFSPNIQNEILNIASDLVLKDISKAVGKTGKFSLIVDETTDVSNKEEVSVCLRYILNGQPAETFTGFHEVESIKGKALFQLVLDVLHKMELRIEDVVDQYYDGASNINGKEKGAATRVQEVAPKAIYVHCYGHLLNLALQDTLQENTVIRNALGVVQSIQNFFNTPKRENVLRSVHMPDIDPTPYSPYIKLKSLSETRWSCRWEAVKAVEQQPERILLALIELSLEKVAKTSADAKGLVKAMLEFQFILGLHTLKVIFSNTNALARYLQGHDVDVMTAKITCDATLETLKKCREEDMFSLIWEKARKTATNKIEIAPDIEEVETKKRQKKPSKRLQALSGETSEELISFTDHQRARIAYYDALDRVLTEMRDRFACRDTHILTCLAKMILGNAVEDDFKAMSEFYNVDQDIPMAETAIFHNLEGVDLNTANTVIRYLYSNALCETLPHLSEMAKNLATLPATSCSAERSFSCLRRLKTYLRSTMDQDRVSACQLKHWELEVKRQLDQDVKKGITEELLTGEATELCARMVIVPRSQVSPPALWTSML
ncbi:zinc finger MYM-type protein 1-like [Macrobrachium rosenbergii]|uniref:zinc finger MYM-type protein 1-like n=1 Tax=Macrobrachium rosenbergii TaxID=79674 RepID=UPI0034D5EA4D